MVIPEQCPALGIQLQLDCSHATKDAAPSLDRIVPALGYVRGNVVVVSFLANRIKTNATPAQIRAVADFYEQLESKRVA